MVGRRSGGCGETVREAVWRVWGGCLEGVERLSEWCGEAVWRVKQVCLEGVGGLSGACGVAV